MISRQRVSVSSPSEELQKNTDIGGGRSAGPVVEIGTFHGRDVIVVLGKPDLLSVDYSSRLRRFADYYLGTPERPAPFGGRAGLFTRLEDWLSATDKPSNLLITAPAGRGKTAALVHWVGAVQQKKQWDVVFVPISIRFGTNTAVAFYQILADKLAGLFRGDGGGLGPVDSVDYLQNKVVSELERLRTQRRNVLVVIDGADEASGWSIDMAIFAPVRSSSVKMVVSARLLAGDSSPDAWRNRLGWTRRGDAETIEVPPLDEAGIADVLAAMNIPLGSSVQQQEFVRELVRLSNGDPLLLGFYIEDLWDAISRGLHPQVTDLTRRETGFRSYFKGWIEQQTQDWQPTFGSERINFESVLAIFASAFGPLPHDDLETLLARPELGIAPQSTDVSQAMIVPLRRFLIGNGQEGYALTHPKLAEFIASEFLASGTRLVAARLALLGWGRDTVENLRKGHLRPEDVPTYLVQFYCAHLSASGSDPTALLTLVGHHWQRAWEKRADDFRGYITDVKKAWAACSSADRLAVTENRQAPLIADQLRCAFEVTRQNEFTELLRPDLCGALLRHGIWSVARAVTFAASLDSDGYRVQFLKQILPFAPPEVVLRMESEICRLDAGGWSSSAKVLCVASVRRLMECGETFAAWRFVNLTEEPFVVASSLLVYASLITKELRTDLILRALSLRPDDIWLVRELIDLFDLQPGDAAIPDGAGEHPYGFDARLPKAVLTYFPDLKIVPGRGPVPSYGKLLANRLHFISRLEGERLVTALLEALLIEPRDESWIVSNLVPLAPYLNEDQLRTATDTVSTLEDGPDRALATLALGLRQGWQGLEAASRISELLRTLMSATTLNDRWCGIRSASAHGFVNEAMSVILEMEPDADLIAEVAPFLNQNQVRKLINFAKSSLFIGRDRALGQLLSRLASFGGNEAREALSLTGTVQDVRSEVAMATALLKLHVPEYAHRKVPLFRELTKLSEHKLQFAAALAGTYASGAITAMDAAQVIRSFGRNELASRIVEFLSPFIDLDTLCGQQLKELLVVMVAVAHAVPDPKKKYSLVAFFRRLAEALGTGQTLKIASLLADDFSLPYTCALVATASAAEQDEQLWFVDQASHLSKDEERLSVLAALVIRTGEAPWREAWLEHCEWRRGSPFPGHRMEDIAFMTWQLPEYLRQEVFSDIERIWTPTLERNSLDHSAVEAMIPFASRKWVNQILADINKIDQTTTENEIRAAGAARLAELGYWEDATRALTAVSSTQIAHSFMRVVPKLACEQLKGLLERCGFRMVDDDRLELWPELNRRWQDLSPLDSLSLMEHWLGLIANRTTREALQDLVGLSGGIYKMGGTSAVEKAAEYLELMQSARAAR